VDLLAEAAELFGEGLENKIVPKPVIHTSFRPLKTATRLAPSPRILAYLARKAAAQSPTLALTVVPLPHMPEPMPFEPPPEVVITPCDPWPRPYYLEEGLRKVKPYHFTYNTYCKERWRGKGLLDIFAKEFRDRPLEYYVCLAFDSLSLRRMGLMNLARSHRDRTSHHQWQDSRERGPHRQEWGCYLPYPPPA
jgi:hypothetical protein